MATKIPLLSFQTSIFLLLFTFSFHVYSQTNFNNQEQTILLKIKDFWLNPSSLSHWTNSSNPCKWPGITCTNNSVTAIRVVNQNITQPIPPSICDLKNLAVLDLNDNEIPGTFPTALYNCANLQYLDLSDNYFTGLIPDDIDRLSTRLEFLNLADNNFTGDIPVAIGRLSGLKELKLYGNLFNGTFPKEIGNLVNLQVLVLNNNGFVPQAIPSSFMGLKNLKNLFMEETNLIGEIPQDIGNLTALEFLDLSTNRLSGNIPPGLFLLKNLSNLFLHKNQLSGIIPPVIEALNMQVLDLSNNSLTGSIPDDFGKLTKLTGLALFFNQLSGQVPVSIGKLPALEDVRLYSNNLSGELPPDFGRYSPLRKFQVSLNKFSGNLPEYLCSNKMLTGLVAFTNNLSGILPQTLADCSSLLYVQLYDNRISGEIPVGLWSSNSLNQLMISDNLFTGQLPGTSGLNLSWLEIDNNQFSGEIPAGLSNSIKIQVLKASNNFFNGSIPQELTFLEELTTLLLNNNSFSGNLPENIVSWKSLHTLYLKKNQLSGQIPKSLGDLPVLTDLDLSENEFSGEVPPDINPQRLNFLNLSSNNLSGRLPTSFQNGAFNTSFLNNPNLCTSSPSLGLRSCDLPDTRNTHKLSQRFIAIISSIAATAFFLACICAFFLIRCYRKKNDKLTSTWKLTSFQKLTFTESTILSNLTENNLIGSGGSGKVYRVPVNRSGGYVAVKSIYKDKGMDQRLEKQFLAEFEILGSIRHYNIGKLMCCLSTDNSNLLVYEYMENRSLDLWLHSKKKKTTISGSVHHVVLDWPKRLPIAVAAASGLCYMHHDSHTPICKKKSQWQKGKLIGRGTFGSVYVASNKETGALCAMKEVEILPDDPKSAECIRQLEQEIKVLSNLQHPNIVQYYGSERAGDRFYIYLEYVHPGSINRFIHDHCGAITESVVRNFTRHILCGLAYLHSTKTIHRDIKGANLLVDAYGVVKLADFGMAKHLNGHAANLSLKGSPYWMAPELLQADLHKDDSTNHALAVDIWSLGCTIIEMVNGKPPWSEYEGPAAMFKVLKETPPIPENLSAEGKDFLNCCFRRNPAERPTASMLLEHCFVKNQHPQDVISSCQSFGGMKSTDKVKTQGEYLNL